MRPAGACLLTVPLAVASFLLHPSERRSANEGSYVATLLANDDLLSSFDFRSGGAGGRVVGGEVRLDDAQLAFDVFASGYLSFGFSRNERVDVLDLGPVLVPPQERSRDRAAEFPVSIFHTLFRDDNGFAYVAPGGDVDPYERADRILTTTPTTGIRHVEPVLGHVYLLRVRRNDTSVDELFKFQVVGLLPQHSVTIRWASVGS